MSKTIHKLMKKPIRKYLFTGPTFTLSVAGLIGFIIFASFLIWGLALKTLENTQQELQGKAGRVATRLEGRLQQACECVELVALNPLVQEIDPETMESLLAEIIRRSSLCEALAVIECDGTLIAAAPPGSNLHNITNNVQLPCTQSECQLLQASTTDGITHYALFSAALTPDYNIPTERPLRNVVGFVNLNYVAETTFLGHSMDSISLFTQSGEEIVLYNPDPEKAEAPASMLVSLLCCLMAKITPETPAYLQGSATLPNSAWVVSATRSMESFIIGNLQTVFSGFPFYILLFFPMIIILVLIIIATNHSRSYFRNLARRDGLTGLYNHRFFQTELRALVNNEKQVSLLMIDIDDFKCFNDTYGHQAGDKILVGVANILRKNIRKKDIAARYGGEEFSVILADTEVGDALRIAERIRQDIKAHGECTVSIGVSSFPVHAATAEELIGEADSALYKAKSISKDRVEVGNTRSLLCQEMKMGGWN